MERFRFDEAVALQINSVDTSAKLARLMWSEPGEVHVAVIYIPAGGVLPRHPETQHQLYCVIDGAGWVASDDRERSAVVRGDAILWSPGEEHESGTDAGMTALVVRGDVRVDAARA